MKIIERSLILLFSVLMPFYANADFAVIVHPSAPDGISKDEVAKIFLAKSDKFADGSSSKPVNQTAGSAPREPFEKTVLGKSPSQVKAYWSRLIFTGKAVPIDELKSDQEVVQFVSATPGAIGYVDSSSISDKVKVILSY